MRILAVLMFALVAGAAHAQSYQVVPSCGDASPPKGNVAGYMDQTGAICMSGSVAVTGSTIVAGTVSTLPQPTGFQGTMTLAAATSTALTAANVTMEAGGSALPTTFANLTIRNTGANPVFVCWFGGTATATSGCELLAAGASDAVNMNHFGTPPSFFSVLGTTLSFRS